MEESLNQLLQDLGLDDSDSDDDIIHNSTSTSSNNKPVTTPQPIRRPVQQSPSIISPLFPLFQPAQNQSQQAQYKLRDPMYEQVGGPMPHGIREDDDDASQCPVVISGAGPLRLPPARPRGFVTVTPDFVRMMRAYEIDPRDEEVRRAFPLLSQEMNRLRSVLREQAQRCDIETYYAYLILLKKVTRFYETADCTFDTYFPCCCNPQSAHFIYEYIQVLLMTGARLYEQGARKLSTRPDQECAEDFLIAQYVYDELRRTAEYCHGDRLLQSGKWIYVASPDAIGSANGAGNYSQTKASIQQSIVTRERATLRNLIRYDLHGIEALELRAILCRAKMTEVGVALMQQQIDHMSSASPNDNDETPIESLSEQRCAKVYGRLAPLMLCCQQHYNTILNRLKQGAPQAPVSILSHYAQYSSYYWYLRLELGQARAEWACFNDPDALDFDTYGKRTVRRLCVLRDSLAQKDQWIQGLGLDAALHREWLALKKQVTQFYEEVRRGVVDSVWHGASGVTIPDIQAYKAPPDQGTLLTIYTERWSQLQTQPLYQSLAQVFDFLEQVTSPNAPSDIVMSMAPSTMPRPYSAPNSVTVATNVTHQPLQATQTSPSSVSAVTLENYRVRGIVEERWNHLDWLVDQIDDDGTLYIDQEGCDYLRRQLELTNQFIAQHNLVFTASSTTSRQ